MITPGRSWPNEITAPDRDAWLAARHTRITASDVGALLGLNKHKSRRALLKEKAAPEPKNFRGNSAMRAGGFLESGVFDWFLDDLRTHVARGGGELPTGGICRNAAGTSLLLGHPLISDQLAASPDGVVEVLGAVRAVEVKLHGPRAWDGGDPTYDDLAYQFDLHGYPHPKVDNPDRCWATPTQYAQVQTQLACMGLPAAYLVRCWGTERRDTIIYACPDFQNLVVRETQRFWKELGR